MRLAVVVDTFPCWSERFVARELSELLRRGAEPVVFCLNAGRIDIADDSDWAGLVERRVVLPSCLLTRAPHDPDPAVRQRIERARAELGLRYAARLRCARSLKELFLRHAVEHVHAHFGNLPSTLAWLAASAAKLPFSFSVHARVLFVEPQLLSEKVQDSVRVFTCHPHGLESLRQRAGSEKIVLMRHGLPLDRFRYAPEPQTAARPPRLLAAGRFVPKKGFNVLLDALARPELADACFTLNIIGEGPGAAKLKSAVKRLGLSGKVRFEAPMTGEAWNACLRQSDLFIAPYVQPADGDRDGVPNIVLEAFAWGVPVIGTDAGGLPDILSAETGTAVPAGDVSALAQALADFIRSPAQARAKAAAARLKVETSYDIRRNIQPFCEMLKIRA